MHFADLESLLLTEGFARTDTSPSFPLVIHGVPGCGKSSLVKQLLNRPGTAAYTCGTPYGANLSTAGVLSLTSDSRVPTLDCRILDEYQLATTDALTHFNVLIGDPFQGTTRLRPHYIKEVSYRVPSPICLFLRERAFQIKGTRAGRLITSGPYCRELNLNSFQAATFLHLGPLSASFFRSHGICSRSPAEVQGAEFDEVVLLYHKDELHNRVEFFVACTRARGTLLIISNEFDEFRATA